MHKDCSRCDNKNIILYISATSHDHPWDRPKRSTKGGAPLTESLITNVTLNFVKFRTGKIGQLREVVNLGGFAEYNIICTMKAYMMEIELDVTHRGIERTP